MDSRNDWTGIGFMKRSCIASKTQISLLVILVFIVLQWSRQSEVPRSLSMYNGVWCCNIPLCYIGVLFEKCGISLSMVLDVFGS